MIGGYWLYNVLLVSAIQQHEQHPLPLTFNFVKIRLSLWNLKNKSIKIKLFTVSAFNTRLPTIKNGDHASYTLDVDQYVYKIKSHMNC